MNEEPIEAKDVHNITLDQLLGLSLEELKKSLGLPYQELDFFTQPGVIEADKPQDHVTDTSKVTEDTKGESNDKPTN